MARPLHPLALAFALALAGCGEEAVTRPPKAPPSPAAAAPAAAKTAQAAPSGHLQRADVDRVLTQQGPVWLLRRVLREETFGKGGAFAGWLITGLPEEWSAIDLKPGDVVVRVNDKPLETPEEAWEAWKSVARAKDLRIALQRDGAARELVVPIDGDPQAEAIRALDQDAPPRRAPDAKAPARGVVQIGGAQAGGDWESDSY